MGGSVVGLESLLGQFGAITTWALGWSFITVKNKGKGGARRSNFAPVAYFDRSVFILSSHE